MNEDKTNTVILLIFVVLMFSMIFFTQNIPISNHKKKLQESEARADSLQEILNKYEIIKPELIKLYYDEKYKQLHNEVDTNTLNSNIELLLQLLSE